MARETGRPPLVHYSEMAYMGFAEVLRHLPSIARILRQAKEAITATRPDALILIDYPSFNLKLARHAKTLGIPVFFYISPKVWAWKEWRVKEMRRYCDKILSILPFEVSYFSGKGLDVEYVGNPSVAEVERKRGRCRRAPSSTCSTDSTPTVRCSPSSRGAAVEKSKATCR